ncbi:dTDP-4-dehydrorhamnose 3,5-epimerase family protein [Trueperella pecoris]|uniref:dTDP-4-dehydrorhamnose 3,5-epimerase family protein n=1 Tax=Trueperella pecoris TaxID=2733571 RepID=A0A7M1QSF9_9ACTO|nr:dTDP-4-dehydrorhamnose 3,5-epimerase [Trueperella pecoris]QOR44786.1 dTDP-4-dehydrorhamnose 3,5-epimerase family protein [Trueperella pecoris]
MVEIIEPKVEKTDIEGLVVITPKQITDERGTIRELVRRSWLVEQGFVSDFEQANNTLTHKGGLRGLHAEAMTKLVTVVSGRAFGAYVDVRDGSPSFGAVVTVDIAPGTMVLVPQGVCNGFQATEDETEYLYFFDREWKPGMPGSALAPLDPELGIQWPIPVDVNDRAMISDKDLNAPRLADLKAK